MAYTPHGIHFEAVGDGFCLPVSSPLVGAFNVSNCLAALAAAVRGLGVDPESAARGIAALPGVPGRMERIDLGQPFTAIVDFAHTPNALRVATETVRRMTGKRVIVIFGSAGLRDKEKRHMMAEIAAQLADVSILTAEVPVHSSCWTGSWRKWQPAHGRRAEWRGKPSSASRIGAKRSGWVYAWRKRVMLLWHVERDMSNPCVSVALNIPGMTAWQCALHWLRQLAFQARRCHPFRRKSYDGKGPLEDSSIVAGKFCPA